MRDALPGLRLRAGDDHDRGGGARVAHRRRPGPDGLDDPHVPDRPLGAPALRVRANPGADRPAARPHPRGLDEADKARQEARELRELVRKEREEAKVERERILDESRRQAQVQLDQARAAADTDLKERLEKNREELEAENARLREQIRRDVVELTLLAAEKVTGKVLDEDDQRRLIDETVAEVDVKRIASEN